MVHGDLNGALALYQEHEGMLPTGWKSAWIA